MTQTLEQQLDALIAEGGLTQGAERMTTLYREIDALGGVIDPNDAEARGRMDMLDTVLAILEKRGFSEEADALSADASVCKDALEKINDTYMAFCPDRDDEFSDGIEKGLDRAASIARAALADLNVKRTRPAIEPEVATLEVGL